MLVDQPIRTSILYPAQSIPISHSQQRFEQSPPSYDDLSIIKMLNKARFPVYLAYSQNNNKKYAMKIFPLHDGNLHNSYKNEIRFSFLNHPNVIKITHFEHKKNISRENLSYLLMDYAPYGDFYDLIDKIKIQDDEKLIRTYFQQLIQGIEYLHSQQVFHMDIKLENLLLGEDYILKITDFDLSCLGGDTKLVSRGTICYRAPEVSRGRCTNYQAADIYSAGIILFILKSGGVLPHCENSLIKGINFFDLLYTCNQKFWDEHCKFQTGNPERFNSDFKELFNEMTKLKPEERANIQTIKASTWYKGEVYTHEELKELMKHHLEC